MKTRSQGKASKGKGSPPPSPPKKPSKPNDNKGAKIKRSKAKETSASTSSPSTISVPKKSPYTSPGRNHSSVNDPPPRFSSRASLPGGPSRKITPSPGRARFPPKYVTRLRGGGIPVGRNDPNRALSTSPRSPRAEPEEDRPVEGPAYEEDLYGLPDDEWEPDLAGMNARVTGLEAEMRTLATATAEAPDTEMESVLYEEDFGGYEDDFGGYEDDFGGYEEDLEGDPALADPVPDGAADDTFANGVGPPMDLDDDLIDDDDLGLYDLPSPVYRARLAAARARQRAIVPDAGVHQPQTARRNQIVGSIAQMRAEYHRPMTPSDRADYAIRLHRAELWREVADAEARMATALRGLEALNIAEETEAVEAVDPNAGIRDGNREGFALGMADPVEPNAYRPAEEEEGEEEEL